MDLPIVRDFGFILAAAVAVGLLARTIRVPLVVAYILAGLFLGPVTGLVHASEQLDLVSEVGIALLLFLVGLEFSLQKIRAVGKVAIGAGLGQIVLTALFGYGLAVLLGFGPVPAAILGLALTFSSTVVVVKLLQRRDEIDATHGRIAVGILLVQDLAVAVALTLLAGLEGAGPIGLETVGRGVVSASLGMVGLVVVALAAVRFVLPPLFGWLSESLEALFVWSLTWCFAFILAAKGLGLSIEIGAFVGGVSLAQLSHSHELIRRVSPLVNFFLAVFFVTLGIHMETVGALTRWPTVVALSAFVLVGKPAILMALVPRFGYGERPSFLASLTLGQISEFSLIIAAFAAGAGLIDAGVVSVIGLVGVITIGVSAALIQVGDGVYRGLRGSGVLAVFAAGHAAEAERPERLRDHVIVVGMNTLGRRLVAQLVERGETVLAVDVDERKLRGLPTATLQGNTEHPAVLEEAGLEQARLLVSALQIEDANRLLAYRARQAGVPSAIHAFDATSAHELEEAGATHLMVSKYDGIRQVAGALRDAGVLD